MSWKSSTHRYGTIAIAIHWVSAVAIVAQLALGFAAASASDAAVKTDALRAHVVLGLFVLALTVIRIGWWFVDRRPTPLADLARWQAMSERFVRVLLYVLILVLGASGISVLALSGAAPVLFLGAPGPLPDFQRYAPMAAHVGAATALLALAGLHVLAALYHHFYRHDPVLARMWTGQSHGAR